MTLADLRKLAIRQQTRIRFTLGSGLECVMNERGIAQIPALQTAPDFNLETELVSVQSFQLDALTSDPKNPIRTRTLGREELAALTTGSATAEVHDHDDD